MKEDKEKQAEEKEPIEVENADMKDKEEEEGEEEEGKAVYKSNINTSVGRQKGLASVILFIGFFWWICCVVILFIRWCWQRYEASTACNI